jgi:hypothetical protein
MTLGLACADQNGIHLAIETAAIIEGPPRTILDARQVMGNAMGKLIVLQRAPPIILLAGGSLDHWRLFMGSWNQNQVGLTLKQAKEQAFSFLGTGATEDDRVFGRVCGYEGPDPVCYAVDREKGDKAPSERRILLNKETAVVGAYATAAVEKVGQGLAHAQDAGVVIRAVLDELVRYDNGLSNDKRELLGPVHTMMIQKP